MTYPQGLPAASQPTDIHDATWGVLSAVYGGAVHPSAEGHAAMADATLPAARAVLGLAAVPPRVPRGLLAPLLPGAQQQSMRRLPPRVLLAFARRTRGGSRRID